MPALDVLGAPAVLLVDTGTSGAAELFAAALAGGSEGEPDVDVDPEERFEILGRRLEEGPLVALEVHPHEVPERRQRLAETLDGV